MPSSLALLLIIIICLAGIFARWRDIEREYRELREHARHDAELERQNSL